MRKNIKNKMRKIAWCKTKDGERERWGAGGTTMQQQVRERERERGRESFVY